MGATTWVDVRIAREDLLNRPTLIGLAGLRSIDLYPPAAGPEVELVFDAVAGAGIPSEDLAGAVLAELLAHGVSVLAWRERTERWERPAA